MRNASPIALGLLASLAAAGSGLGCGARPPLAGDTSVSTASPSLAPDIQQPPEAVSAASDAPKTPPETPPPPRYPDARTVVFAWPPTELRTLPSTLDGHPVTGTWMPADSDIARFDRGLPEFLRAHAKEWSRPALDTRQTSYFRQFGGLIASGRPYVHGNFFCTALDHWKTARVGVDDGGDCFFEVVMDAETGAFTALMINGHG